jgi:hypothetical protein|tara:strand:- start:1122 stop:1241 length:120 start_codon:yes stop_codon:yes gene_type:complete
MPEVEEEHHTLARAVVEDFMFERLRTKGARSDVDVGHLH